MIPVLPPQTEEAYNPRSVWSRGVVPVLAIALVVGSIAYFLGVAFAPDDGPTDRVLETQSAALDPAGMTDRELSEELVGAGATASAVDAAGGAPSRRLNPAAETLSDASTPFESGDSAPGTRPAPAPEPASLPPAGSPEVEQPGTRTVRVPAAGAGAPPALPEATPATGWLLVRTDPPGATVTLDGVGRGQTPLSLRDVSFGTHRLEVSRAGFGTVQREVTLNGEETVVPVGVSLAPAGRSAVAVGDAAQTGSLAVRSRPPGAQVMVDETVAGVTPLVVALPVGRYQVRIQGDGYRPVGDERRGSRLRRGTGQRIAGAPHPMKALLALENGLCYRGESAGAPGQTQGEVVFNTNLTGYQEVLTDPSYSAQIVTMTCPQIGNYGVAVEDSESQAPQVAGFVIREESPIASNWRASGTLRNYLETHGIVAISGIDTRALTRVLRTAGVMRGVIGTGTVESDELVEAARQAPKMEGSDLVRAVTCAEPFEWTDHDGDNAQMSSVCRRSVVPHDLCASRRTTLDETKHSPPFCCLRLSRVGISCADPSTGTAGHEARWRVPE